MNTGSCCSKAVTKLNTHDLSLTWSLEPMGAFRAGPDGLPDMSRSGGRLTGFALAAAAYSASMASCACLGSVFSFICSF